MRHRSRSTSSLLLAMRGTGAELAEAAAHLGWAVDGPFATSARALAHLEDARPGFALVGTVLDDGTAVPLVSALRRLGVPFVLMDRFEPATGQVHALVSYGQGWVEVGLDELLPLSARGAAEARPKPPLPLEGPARPERSLTSA